MKLPKRFIDFIAAKLKNITLRPAGFSIIEILVVVAIIGIMAAIGTGVASSVQKNTRDAQREADLRVVQSALQQYYADNNFYPNSLNSILSTGGTLDNNTGKYCASGCPTATKVYLKAMPRDPDGTAYGYQSTKSVTSSTNCDMSGGTSNVCHYYFLCAKKENSTSGSCNGSAVTYNYQVTPL